MSNPEKRHAACWYGHRTSEVPDDVAAAQTIEDGQLLFCSHPMWFPVVGYYFDVRNCPECEYFRGRVRVAAPVATPRG